MIFSREPVAIIEVIRLSLVAAVAFGLPLSDGQSVALIALASAVLSVIARQRVTPVGSGRAYAEGSTRGDEL